MIEEEKPEEARNIELKIEKMKNKLNRLINLPVEQINLVIPQKTLRMPLQALIR